VKLELPNSAPSQGSVQLHIRLSAADAELLRNLAKEREQTLSGFIRFLLRPFRRRAAPRLGIQTIGSLRYNKGPVLLTEATRRFNLSASSIRAG